MGRRVDYPKDLDPRILENSFRAPNGELGIRATDVQAFLNACQQSRCAILGWEMWIVDHRMDPNGEPLSRPGFWCGGIPQKDSAVPAVMGGETSDRKTSETWEDYVDGTIRDTWSQIEEDIADDRVDPRYVPFLRFNLIVLEQTD